jgi:hypothetical protein
LIERARQTVAHAVYKRGWVILNAADPVAAALAEHARGQVLRFEDGDAAAAVARALGIPD